MPASLDANGFDPTEFEWRPVPRRPRADGWTPEVQQRFIEALARTGVVERACEAVNMSVASAYKLRAAPGGEGFARAWSAVLAHAADRLLDIAFEHAIEGEEVPVFDRDGCRIGAKRRYNTRMAMFLLRAYHPERFRHAHSDTRAAGETLPPPPAPLPRITASLAPETPAEPHRLATPERLDDMVYGARFLAAVDELHPKSDQEPYRATPVPAHDPKVAERGRRARILRAERGAAADEAWAERNGASLNFASTSEDEPPRDPLSDYTYWAEQEAARRREQEEAADEELEDGELDDLTLDDEDLFEDEDDEEGEEGDPPGGAQPST